MLDQGLNQLQLLLLKLCCCDWATRNPCQTKIPVSPRSQLQWNIIKSPDSKVVIIISGLTGILGWLGSWADWNLGLTGILNWLGSWSDKDSGLLKHNSTVLIIKVAIGSKFKLINIVEFSHTQGMLCSSLKD